MTRFFEKFCRFLRGCSGWAQRHYLLSLLLISGVAFAMKLLGNCMESGVGRDAALYLIKVQEWHDSGVAPSGWVPPMLYVLIRAVMALGVSAYTAGTLINLGMGACSVFIASGIAFEATANKKIALASAAFAALHPGLNELSIEIQRDVPYLFFSGISVWLAFAAVRRKKWYLWSFAGALLAISFLTRYESAEFFLLFPAAVLCCAISGRISWKQAALSTFSLFAVSFAVLALFFAVYADGKMINEYRKYYSNKADVIERSVMEKEDFQP